MPSLPTYRSILSRVAIAGAFLAVLMGGAAFSVETAIIDARVLSLAQRESEAFLAEASASAFSAERKDAIAESLGRLIAARWGRADGQFIVAEVYDTDQRKVAEYVREGKDWAEERLQSYAHGFPAPDGVWYERFFFDGLVFIQIMVPLVSADGKLLGYFEHVFELSAEKSGEILRDIATVVAVSVLSAIAAVLVLLPIFAAFNRGIMRLSRDLMDANIDILSVLGSAIAKRDSDTNTHNYRVTILSIRLAEALGLDRPTIRRLIKGAFLHDVGKIAIPDAILLKPGKLDEQEFAVMKTHVAHGIDIVEQSSWLADATDVVGHHHEKVDGSGYPAGIGIDSIPITARVFAVIDVFDALTSRRPYKEPMPFDKAMGILDSGAGTHFDTEVLARFRSIVRPLHEKLAGLDEEGIKDELRVLLARYFIVR